jgi:heme-degrading monooxygenase HmoA
MVVVVFRARLKPGIQKEYQQTDARMAKLAATMPGFVSYRQYASADGEDVAVVEFASQETVAAWGAHPEHREAQRLGRERWFTEYRITVCDAVREYSFRARVSSSRKVHHRGAEGSSWRSDPRTVTGPESVYQVDMLRTAATVVFRRFCDGDVPFNVERTICIPLLPQVLHGPALHGLGRGCL